MTMLLLNLLHFGG